MFGLIMGVVLIIIGVGLTCYLADTKEGSPAWGLGIIAFGCVAIALGCFYSQDAGEVVVKRSISGALAGYTEEAGFHTKKPWESTIIFPECLISDFVSKPYSVHIPVAHVGDPVDDSDPEFRKHGNPDFISEVELPENV